MMGWTPRPTASMCQSGGVEHHLREASVSEVIIVGLDIAKHVFHVYGADERGRAIFSKRISRGKLLDFFAAQPSCTVALEACGGAHHWARQLTQLGHDVRLIPPAYVKPFVKRQKKDAFDAEAICEAAQRPSMRFVAVKSEQQQAAGLVFRTRDLLVRQLWFRSANSHTGPQLHRCIRGRTDGSIRLRANLLQKPLASGGASTDEYTSCSVTRKNSCPGT